LLDDGVTSYAYGKRRIGDTTIEVPIIEVCESDKWTHIPEEYIECEERCKSVVCESEPVVRVVVEEETVKLNNPKVEYIKPYDLFFLKVVTFRRAERKLSYARRTAQLLSFKWSNDKMTQYMSESDKPLLCEYTRQELNSCRKGYRDRGLGEDEIEEEISRKVYESKEKLIRRYEGYLGIREDTGGNPIRTYRRWLRDLMWEYDDEDIEILVDAEFGDKADDDHNDWANLVDDKEEEWGEEDIEEEQSEVVKPAKTDQELMAEYDAFDYDGWVAEQYGSQWCETQESEPEKKDNNVKTRSRKDPKVRPTKKDDHKSRHKHRSHKHKSKY
jgi:hypothetical protein